MRSPDPNTDHLIHAARRVVRTGTWLIQELSDHGHSDGCCTGAAEAFTDALATMPTDPFTRYSDGRPICSTVAVDGDGMEFQHLWPADPADMPAEPWEELPTALAPRARHGDRGYVVVRWDPRSLTGSVRYIEPLRAV
ncbi:hypothetical protein MYK68_04890 [Gordonia sp. PP30]|uniref:hypothetical protein n=1 Tax=Gordonia sp. PP30 TaxID=2935861 RepID=UPI001FFEEE3F|nr:hypothetical protein [Gordonia sp. PP30]UQE75939.1 hypothetical protein MYK68_04890 [Gordonia sp. PP30]